LALLVTGIEFGLTRCQRRALVQKALRPLARHVGHTSSWTTDGERLSISEAPAFGLSEVN